MDRIKVKKYFKKLPKWLVILLIIGILFLFGEAKMLGFIMFLIGGLGIFYFYKEKITDQEFDEILNEDLEMISRTALIKTDINSTELVNEEVFITGPKLWDTAGAEIHYKKGKDKLLRFTPIAVTVINFTKNQLLLYNCTFDMITRKCLNESTEEYFYKDVVSVSSSTESKTIISSDKKIGTLQLNAAESFKLTTSGGTSVSVVLSDPTLIQIMGGGEIPKTRAEKAIQIVRKMLRDKKSN